MTTGQVFVAAAVAVLLWGSAFGSPAQRLGSKPTYSALDLLVWGADAAIDATPYALEVRTEIARHVQRWQSYKSARPRPAKSAELDMVYSAQVRYERRLVAATQDSRGTRFAKDYVDTLRPCYEWEGYHDCPEREALFATDYQAANLDGPFSQYLPLLAAHRWLCAAEGYEYEKRPADAIRSRTASQQALSVARRSATLLVRTAAEELATRGRCFAGP
jgi:hypothetical protein